MMIGFNPFFRMKITALAVNCNDWILNSGIVGKWGKISVSLRNWEYGASWGQAPNFLCLPVHLTKLLIVNQFMNGWILTADGTLRILTELHLFEIHC